MQVGGGFMGEEESRPYDYTYALKVKDSGKSKEFIEMWIKSVYYGLQTLDDETAKKVLSKCGRDCAKIFLRLYGRDLSKMTLEDWIRIYGEAEGCKCERNGDYIIYEFKPVKCECLLVEEGLVKLTPKLCSTCFTNWLEYQLSTVTGKNVKAELVESLATGSNKCVFKIWLK